MANILRKIWQEFIYGGHLLSLGAACLAWSAGIILGKSFSLELFAIAYFISQVIYSFDHYKDIKKDARGHSERADYLNKQQWQAPFLLVFYLVALAILTGFTKNIAVIVFVAAFLIGGILFPLVFKGFTKKILGFKNFYTAFFWAAGSAFLPFFYYKYSIGLVFVLFFVFVFLRSMVAVVFFDLKDEEVDRALNLKTFPVVLGREKTLLLVGIVNLSCIVLLAIGVCVKLFPMWTVALSLLSLYSCCYLNRAWSLSAESIRKLSYIMVDGEYIFWPILLLSVKCLFSLL